MRHALCHQQHARYTTPMLTVTAVETLNDNYVWLLHAPADPRRVYIVDPGDARPVETRLAADRLEPAGILVTHHHPDHTGGVSALVAAHDLPVWGPATEAHAVVDHPLSDGDILAVPVDGLRLEAMTIPGHTLGHTAFFGHGALFPGDTLFSAGCGRLFEGSPEQMLTSLERLAGLPGETLIYCGHEYTVNNLRFAASVEPGNADIANAAAGAAALRKEGRPTLPSRIDREKRINPFLRCHLDNVRQAAEQWSNSMLNDKVQVFATVRRWKDQF